MATSSGTSRRRLRTRGRAWTTSGYGTGQGLAAYALGDAVVRRDHLGALNPADGKALEWHPGSNSFEGNKAMEATPHGLLTGGDAGRQGGASVGRVAFFDLDQLPAASNPDTTIDSPIAGPCGPDRAASSSSRATATLRPAPSSGSRSRSRAAASTSRTTAPGAAPSTPSTRALGTPRPGPAVTPWSLPVTIADAREITVRARAVTTDGTQDPVEGDQEDRVVQLRRPAADHQHLVAERLAADVDVVRAARQRVRRQRRQLGRRSTSVTSTPTATSPRTATWSTATPRSAIDPDDPGAISTTWQHEVDLPNEGNWKIGAMARDTAGQSDTRWDDARVHRRLLGPAADRHHHPADRGHPAGDASDAHDDARAVR